jgi:DHA2 family multidrug resistance protein
MTEVASTRRAAPSTNGAAPSTNGAPPAPPVVPAPTALGAPLGRAQWLSLAVVLVGTMMVSLDTTIVNVALPQIRENLHAGKGIEWIVTAYLLAVAVSQPATGWAADRYGRKPIFISSLGAFTLASMLCAVAPNLPALVVFRVLQGLGGGALQPVGMAIVVELFPPERRGRAMSVWGICSMAAPAIGPTLGGYLVTAVSWHWLFLINVPIGALGVVLGIRVLRDFGYRESRRLDSIGLLLGGGGLALMLFAITQASDWGWSSTSTLSMIAIGVVALGSFVVHELRTEQPMIDLRMFRITVFGLSMIVTVFIVTAQYTRLVFIPLSLETIRGYSALRVGLVLTPAALLTAVGMSIGGRMVDRVGARRPMVLGTGLMCVGAFSLSHIGVSTPVWAIVGSLGIQGIGFGLCALPGVVVAMNALPPRYVAQASAVRSLVSQVAGASSIAILSAVVAIRLGDGTPTLERSQTAYDTAFLLASLGLFVALLCSFFFSGKSDVEPTDEVSAPLLAGDH